MRHFVPGAYRRAWRARRWATMSSTNRETFDLAIVGAGPGGLSAAARASQNGLSHVLLEAADKHANTVQQYQQRKHVMAEPQPAATAQRCRLRRRPARGHIG